MNTDCDHTHVVMTRFKKSNNTIMVTKQCQACGQRVGDGKNRDYDLDSLPWFDEELREQGYKNSWEKAKSELQKQVDNNTSEWWKNYNDYLESPEWRRLRQLVIVRDNYRCQNCFSKVTEYDAHVHHLYYSGYNRLGYSFAFECVTLCRACHAKYHQGEGDV